MKILLTYFKINNLFPKLTFKVNSKIAFLKLINNIMFHLLKFFVCLLLITQNNIDFYSNKNIFYPL